MSGRRLLVVVVLCTAALTGAFASGLEWTDLEGKAFRLESLRGKVVVLNFWATWCKPCVEEMPELETIRREWRDLGVRVVGASADGRDQADAVRRFAEAHGLSFPLVLGATTHQMEDVGLPPTLPGTVLVDRDGTVVRRYPGVIDRGELEEDLQSLLDGTLPAEGAAAGADPQEAGEAAAHEHAHDHGASSQASLVPS